LQTFAKALPCAFAFAPALLAALRLGLAVWGVAADAGRFGMVEVGGANSSEFYSLVKIDAENSFPQLMHV